MSLSACLIVKNEARNLARCLDSLAGLASEIIVVDTGSTDDTVAIARRYTDKVFEHPWNDHFAEARNLGLAQATGDWILVLDADEVIPAETARLIPAYIRQPEFQDRPVVLNFRFRSEHHPDLYSRGLFPNGFGIQFAGRVHEVPVLPGQNLPSYHCQELHVWHASHGDQDQSKQRYYQRLLLQNLAEESDPARLNHVQKHLGLNHLSLAEWSAAWNVLSDCYQGMQELDLQSTDGFYGEVLRGLVQAGLQLDHPNTRRYAQELKQHYPLEPIAANFRAPVRQHRWRKGMVAVTMSLLAACQPASTLPNSTSNQSKQTPILLKKEDTDLSAVPQIRMSNNPSQMGDFQIQSVYFCPAQNATVTACYASGGNPVVKSDPNPPYFYLTSTDPNGYTCYIFDHCDGGTQSTPTPTPTPVSTPTPVPTPTPNPNGTPTPSPSSGCSNTAVLMPSKLKPIFDKLPKSPPINPDAVRDNQQAAQQKQRIQQQINDLNQLPPNANRQNKLNNLQTQLNTVNATLSQTKSQLLASANQLDAQRADVNQQLNQLDGVDAEDDSIGDLTGFDEFIVATASAQEAFEASIQGENTFDLVDATRAVDNEMALLSQLLRSIAYQTGPSDPEQEPTPVDPETPLSQIRTPKRLAIYLNNHIQKNSEKLNKKNNELNNEINQDIQETRNNVLESQEILQKALLFQLIADGILNPDTLEITIPSDFSILTQVDRINCIECLEASATKATAEIHAVYGSMSNFMHSLQDPVYAWALSKSIDSLLGAGTWRNLPLSDKYSAIESARLVSSMAGLPTEPEDLALIVLGVKGLDSANDARKLAQHVGQNVDLAIQVLRAIEKRFAHTPGFNGSVIEDLIKQLGRLKNDPQAVAKAAAKLEAKTTKACLTPAMIAARAAIDKILADPKTIWGKSVNELKNLFEQAGAKVVELPPISGTSGNARNLVINPPINSIQKIEVHSGNGLHKGPYYKLSTSSQGIVKVVDRTYVSTPGETAKLIYIN